MSAVYNNIKTMSLEDLDRQRHNDRIEPAFQHAFDTEYRLRCLEKGTVASTVEEVASVQNPEDVPTVSADLEETAESTSGTQEGVPHEVTCILNHFNGNIVQVDDKFFAESTDDNSKEERFTPAFDTEEELFVFMVNHATEWLDKTADTFEFFWEEDLGESEAEVESE